MSDKFTVYLCGGINKLSDTDARDWREAAKALLPDWEALDPMRRDYRGKELDHVEDIVRDDIKDIEDSDAILVNCSKPSWGTAMEIRLAWERGILLYGFGAGDKPSPWLTYHVNLYPSIEQAITTMKNELEAG